MRTHLVERPKGADPAGLGVRLKAPPLASPPRLSDREDRVMCRTEPGSRPGLVNLVCEPEGIAPLREWLASIGIDIKNIPPDGTFTVLNWGSRLTLYWDEKVPADQQRESKVDGIERWLRYRCRRDLDAPVPPDCARWVKGATA